MAADQRIFSADAYLGFKGTVAEKLANGEGATVNAYLRAVSAPMVTLFKGIADKVARPLWTAVAMHSGKQFVTVELVGRKKDFRGKVIRELLRQSRQAVNPHEIQRAVCAQLRSLEVAGIALQVGEEMLQAAAGAEQYVLAQSRAGCEVGGQELGQSTQHFSQVRAKLVTQLVQKPPVTVAAIYSDG